MKPQPKSIVVDGTLDPLLQRRAERLRREGELREDDDGNATWVAAFPVGRETFALPVESLSAAVPLRLVSPVPLAPPEVVGVFRHDGELLPVYSLASLLGVRGWKHDPSVVLVVQLSGGRRIAVDCEQVPVPVPLQTALVLAARASEPGAVAQVLPPGAPPVQLVDPERLFARRGA